ncbi:hypothetical protein C8R47DRAFT_1229380 [Mycena vitilis]|nr:hypothetical protein C8R47DRAFT_1229380 [Mycena vitilis]
MHLNPDTILVDATMPQASTSQLGDAQVPPPLTSDFGRPAQSGSSAPPTIQFVNPERRSNLPFPELSSFRSPRTSRPPRTSADLLDETDLEFLDSDSSSESDDESDYMSSDSQLRPPRMKSAVPLFGSGSTRTILDMPLRGSKDAPKTFRGHHSEVKYFIAHYDRLITKFNVTDPTDQCKLILDYCSTDVQGFIRASKYYQKRSWLKLRREILLSYDADRANSKYKPSDVARYTLKTQSRPFHNLSQWKGYYRKYKTMAGALVQQGHITRVNYDVYFWLGVEQDLRRTLEQRINQLNPGRNMRNQYSVREINEAAEWYFRRNRAEAMVVNAADYGIDLDSGTTDAGSEDESDDSDDSDYETYRQKHRAKLRAKKDKEKEKKKKPKKTSTSAPGTSKTRTLQTTGTAEEVTSMIRQLNKMSIADPEYAPVYYKVLTLDSTGIAAKCVQPPRLTQPWTDSGARGPPRAKGPATGGTSNPAGLATYPNNIPVPTGCFGCGIEGHRIGDCPEIRDLMGKDVLSIDEETRRVRMKDGSLIRRGPNETLVQAARRIAAPRVMFATSKKEPVYPTYDIASEDDEEEDAPATYMFTSQQPAYPTYDIATDDEDPEDYLEEQAEASAESELEIGSGNDERTLDANWYVTHSDVEAESLGEGEVYLTVPQLPFPPEPDEDGMVNAAERTMPGTRAARKEIFDGVMMPRRDPAKAAPRPMKSSTPKETVNSNGTAARKLPETPLQQVRDLLPELTPVDARVPRTDVDMPEMERLEPEKGLARKRREPFKDLQNDTQRLLEPPEAKTSGRHSEIQATVQIPSIIERILDLTLPMTVREAFVASKDIRAGIMDTIRLKNVKAVLLGRSQDNPLVAHWNWPRTDGILIKIDVESAGRKISAIVDTGSQLDVVRADIAALRIQRPVDMSCTTNMSDANGGRGQLRGYIQDVELNCGGVLTSTDVWVSHQAPFELLLGRPWQRGNLVTIDERDEGTYLVFKDRDTRLPRYELLAIPYQSTSHPKSSDPEEPTSNLLTYEVETVASSKTSEPNATPMLLWRGAKPARRVQAKQLENQASGQLWAAFCKLLPTLPPPPSTQPAPPPYLRRLFHAALASPPLRVALFRPEPSHSLLSRATFLAGNERITSALLTTSLTEWVQHRKGNELTVRPGSVVAPQTLYTGSETRPNGQEVQHAIFLNARMLVHNPATGEPGMRNGHVVAHLYLAPTADKPWDLEVPYPSAAQVRTALTTYGPTVHREVERVASPTLTVDASPDLAPVPQLPISFPSPPYSRTCPRPRPPPRTPSPRTNKGGVLLDTGLIDEETGHEVLALPTGSGSARPASPRPGTPAPPRRISDVSMEEAPPRKTRRYLDDEEMASQLEELRRALAKKLVIPEAPVAVDDALEEQNGDQDAECDTDSEYAPPTSSGDENELVAVLNHHLAESLRESQGRVEEGTQTEDGEVDATEQSQLAALASAASPCSNRLGSGKRQLRGLSPSTADESTGTHSRYLSPIAEDVGDDLTNHFVHIPPPTPELLPTAFECRSPRPIQPSIASHGRPPLRLPTSSSYALDDIPPLTDISSGSDEFRLLQEVTSDYFAGVSPIVSDNGGTNFPYHRSSLPPVVVDDAELRAELEYIQHAPSPAVDPTERTLDWVRMQAVAEQQDRAVRELEATENDRTMAPLERGAVAATRALELLDLNAMEKGEKINVDTYRHGLELDEDMLHDARERAIESCLDTITIRCEDGTRRVRDDYGIAISEDGMRFRLLSADAMMRQAMYRLALRLLSIPRLRLIAFFVELRACVVDFIRSAAALSRTRRWRYDLTQLHNSAHIPPPYLFGHEYALLRLIYYQFLDAGHLEVVAAIEGLLRLRFQEPAVVTHFLYGGLLDANDTHFRPDTINGPHAEKSSAGTRLTKDWRWEDVV